MEYTSPDRQVQSENHIRFIAMPGAKMGAMVSVDYFILFLLSALAR